MSWASSRPTGVSQQKKQKSSAQPQGTSKQGGGKGVSKCTSNRLPIGKGQKQRGQHSSQGTVANITGNLLVHAKGGGARCVILSVRLADKVLYQIASLGKTLPLFGCPCRCTCTVCSTTQGMTESMNYSLFPEPNTNVIDTPIYPGQQPFE